MHLRVLKELVNIIARPLTVFHLSQVVVIRGDFQMIGKKTNVISSSRKEDPEHDRLVNLTSVSRKSQEALESPSLEIFRTQQDQVLSNLM